MTYMARLRITNDKCNPQCVLTDAFNFAHMRERKSTKEKFSLIYVIAIHTKTCDVRLIILKKPCKRYLALARENLLYHFDHFIIQPFC